MKKTLNADAVANELRGGSAFFPNYHEEAAPQPAPDPTPLSTPQPQPPTSSAPVVKPQNHGNVEPRNHGNVVLPTATRLLPPEGVVLDLSARADIKHTFQFTQAELELLEDIKISLRREADLRIAMNDIVRLGIRVLAEDYKLRKTESLIVSILGKKK